nr:MAG TPA: hypothetical protein [Caudoviricetes sp.]
MCGYPYRLRISLTRAPDLWEVLHLRIFFIFFSL